MPRHRRSSARGSVPERSLSDPILLELIIVSFDKPLPIRTIGCVRVSLRRTLNVA